MQRLDALPTQSFFVVFIWEIGVDLPLDWGIEVRPPSVCETDLLDSLASSVPDLGSCQRKQEFLPVERQVCNQLPGAQSPYLAV